MLHNRHGVLGVAGCRGDDDADDDNDEVPILFVEGERESVEHLYVLPHGISFHHQ